MYEMPTDLHTALRIAARPGGQVIAGGTDVYPAMGRGKSPAAFLDVTRIGGMAEIAQTEAGVRIGAGATWTRLLRAELPPAFDALKQAARAVGSVQIQNTATLAGNLCTASPAADGVPCLLVLDASVELSSAARGTRVLPLAEFITGVRRTALAPDELMTAILVPPVPAQAGTAFEKLGSRRYLVISIAMTAALVSLDPAGRIAEARVAVGSCSAVACRLTRLERDIVGSKPEEVVLHSDHLSPLSPIDDVRGSAAYRLDAVAEQCARAIRRAARHE